MTIPRVSRIVRRAQRVVQQTAARARLVWGHCRRGRAKADSNAGELDDEFLALGCSLVMLDEVGDSVPDRLVGGHGRCVLVEYKRDGRRPSDRGQLSEGQEAFARLWRGGQVYVVRTREEARGVVAYLRGSAG